MSAGHAGMRCTANGHTSTDVAPLSVSTMILRFLPVLNVSSDINHMVSGVKLSVHCHVFGQHEQQCQKPEASAAGF